MNILEEVNKLNSEADALEKEGSSKLMSAKIKRAKARKLEKLLAKANEELKTHTV